ncbi:UDP-galactose/UDP-glucose transporter 3 [Sesamum angolense]|uniref:UDP-galactose/UDP-glucose transporter 3 n=1 Tax=Sesamum angolense TaxID=2727404 RepID=A0AAE1WUI0_9LAMI|nr:UDP-galactose/UDP-glucose transporter 3 [Sesamum angolense]
MESHGAGLRRVFLLAFCVAGIWAAYIYQGVLQETVSTKRFGPDKKRFEHLALNLAQNVVCLIWSFLSGELMLDMILVVLAKSSKMIPVMLMGTLVYGIKYTFPEYVCTLLVAGGISTFALSKSSSKTISKLAHPNAPIGYSLCFLNLAFDGFTNATQDSITASNLMEIDIAIQVLLDMMQFGSASNIQRQHGTSFCTVFAVQSARIIFLTRFGSLTNTTITTTRKFVSIVVSSLLSGNPLSEKQWGSVVMVFSGLSYQIYLKWKKLQRMQKKRKST